MGGEGTLSPHKRRLMSRAAGEGTRCRVPSPDPIFPEDRGWLWCPAYRDWNGFILLGPELFELVLQTGWVPACAVTDGVLGFLSGGQRGEEALRVAGTRRRSTCSVSCRRSSGRPARHSSNTSQCTWSASLSPPVLSGTFVIHYSGTITTSF